MTTVHYLHLGDWIDDILLPNINPADGAWHDFVVVRADGNVKVYHNGELVSTVTDPDPDAMLGGGDLTIGADAEDDFDYVDLFDVRVYSAGLSAQAIAYLSYDLSNNHGDSTLPLV